MNILVVDDDTVFSEQVAEFILNLGHTAFTGENGQHALDILARENIHLVLTDMQMPVMNGREFLRRVKNTSTLNHVVTIILTGYGNVKDAVECMRDGAYDYLMKPVNLNELEIVIKKVGEYIALKQENAQLSKHFNLEVQKAVTDIKRELNDLRRAYIQEVGKTEILVKSEAFKKVITIARKLHQHPEVPVLIEGETGTGKEIVARLIHYGDHAVTTPFVGLNCAIITPPFSKASCSDMSPELSPEEIRRAKGKIELAGGGTIFLDEITELPLNFQAKLLRIIQEREYYRVGGVKLLTTDTRFICATNQNISQKVTEELFREDLFFRLNVGHIVIPPLRERKEEILPLCNMFLSQLAAMAKVKFQRISSEAEELLENYSWPGNVRELKNTMERLALFVDDHIILPHHLQPFLRHPLPKESMHGGVLSLHSFSLPDENLNLQQHIHQIVEKALQKHNGKKTATALYLGISLRVLDTHLKNMQ